MEPLYHYCSTATFHAIGSTRTVRLSSLTASNDALEGKLVSRIMRRLCERQVIAPATIDRLSDAIAALEHNFDGLGLCLSERGDTLSQWRGYGSDGAGVAIGFSHPDLAFLSELGVGKLGRNCMLRKVAYDSDSHEQALQEVFDALLPHLRAQSASSEPRAYPSAIDAFPFGFEVHGKLLEVVWMLYGLKPEEFREEHEWRLLSLLHRLGDQECRYHVKGERLVPYCEIQLPPLSTLITDVTIGPKNMTPTAVIEDFLRRSGFIGVNVVRSSISYR